MHKKTLDRGFVQAKFGYDGLVIGCSQFFDKAQAASKNNNLCQVVKTTQK